MIKQLRQIDAVILAGGQNRRFQGKQKSLVRLQGQSLLDHQLRVINPLFARVILITNTFEDFSDYPKLEKFGDVILDKGPLSGIHAGLTFSNKDYIFVFAGDMPFINAEVIKNQVECINETRWDAVIPETRNGPEPLHGIYNRQITPKLEDQLNKTGSYAVRKFLNKMKVFYWSVTDQKTFININSEEELARYEKHSHYKDTKWK